MSKKQFTFHLLTLSHLPQHKDYVSCAFTQKNRKLSKLLTGLGHKVYAYCSEGSDIAEYCNSDNLIQVETHSLADIRSDYGDGFNLDDYPSIGYDWSGLKTGSGGTDFRHDFSSERKPSTLKFYKNAIEHINNVKKPDDFVLNSMGYYFKPVCDEVNLFLTVESGIGYRGSCKSYFRAFESSFIRDYTYGSENPFADINGNFYDRVIGNYFDLDDFEYKDKKEDYYLFIGRMISRKGVEVAVKTCNELGKRLIIAGQGAHVDSRGYLVSDDMNIPPGTWEHFGFANVEDRKKLMTNAIASFAPTLYQEIFGGVHIEARLSGTPVLTTDFGVYTGTVENGIDGYKCNTLDDFVWGAKKCVNLDHSLIRKRAERYSMDNIKWEFNQWFHDLHSLYESAMDSNKTGWHRVEKEEIEWRKNLYYNK